MNENINPHNNQENTPNTENNNSFSDGTAPENRSPNTNGWHKSNSEPSGYQPPSNNVSYNYQAPQYGQGSGGNVPPYKDPNNMYHYGRDQQPVDEYKWNLNDYSNQPGGFQGPAKKKNKGLKVFLSMIAIVLGVSITGFAVFGVYVLTGNRNIITESSSAVVEPSTLMPDISIKDKPETTETSLPDGKMTNVQIAKKVKPTVVGIQSYELSGLGISGEGSGVIMTANGYILTNAHVVKKAQGLKVILNNDEVFAASLIGFDEQTDIAVIKIDATNLTYADFGNSDQIEVGEDVLAIGNPAGMELAGSVTHGMVSAINRNLKTEAGYNMNYIQVDAAINPGNSGGALVNEYGQVIGINTAKISATDYEGIGFAIPINEAMVIAKDLIENGTVTGRATLGFSGIQLDSVTASRYGLPMGISIQSISAGSDLSNKGIVPGDVVTKLDNRDIADFADVRAILNEHKPGDVISMTVYRKNSVSGAGKYIEVSVKLVDNSTITN